MNNEYINELIPSTLEESIKGYKYEKAIGAYLQTNNFLYILTLGSKREILDYLKKYSLKYETDLDILNRISYVLDNIDTLMELELKTSDFEKLITYRLHYTNSVYLRHINEILFISEKEAVDLLLKKNESFSIINRSVKEFIKKYPNQTKEIEKLHRILDLYSEKARKKLDKTSYVNVRISTDKTESEVRDEEELFYKRIYNSNLSVEEYASLSGVRIETLNRVIKLYATKDEINEINKRTSPNYKALMIELGNRILNENNFDAFDFFTYTKLTYADFREEMLKLFSHEDVIKMARCVSPFYKVLNYDINKNEELNIVSTISGRVITREEKEKIFKYLEDNDYPIGVYKIALRKYANGEIDFGMQKKKI